MPRRAERRMLLVSGALLRPALLRRLGWTDDRIRRALDRRPDPRAVVAVEDVRYRLLAGDRV